MSIHGAEVRSGPLVQLEPRQYDALLLVSYGGPEGPDDVMPFLENATRGRGVPRDRLLEVAEHYQHFGGVSPINVQNRTLIAALEAELARDGPVLPIYFGNRNWHPYLEDTIREMRDAGVRHALALVTSAFSCYSGCRQYREDVIQACAAVGEGAPTFDKLRVFYNHPGFIEANADRLRTALESLPADRRQEAHVVFTAHSIPAGMARQSAYEVQLLEAARLVAEVAGVARWSLAYQSRSGPPQVPWLEPDIGDHLEGLAASGVTDVVVQPIGFLSDHMEVLYDLDHEASDRAAALKLGFVRAASVGTHPAFIAALRELIVERMTRRPERRALGRLGPSHDICPVDCCLDGRGAGRPVA
ncbi:MAG TPA: ferrochelatase [Gemmatimonadales bacterium]|nr:ferrochelatase [Gemmatimonadales bacterium]